MKYTIVPKPQPDNEIWFKANQTMVESDITSAYTNANVIGLKHEDDWYKIVYDDVVTSINWFNSENPQLLGSKMTEIHLPNRVTSIEYGAFEGCSSLTNIIIPNSVTSIGGGAFENCYFIKDHFINNSSLDAEANNYWGATIVDSEVDGILIKDSVIIKGRPNITFVAIPNSVTSIGEWAFLDCSSLTSIVIPESVKSIGDYAFARCESLTSIVIPGSVTSIGEQAFYECSSLTSIVISDGVASVGGYAFGSCYSLTSIVIPDSMIIIGDNAFWNTGIYNEESNWDNGVLYIDNCLIKAKEESMSGAYAIKENTQLIGDNAFWHCVSLTSITIPNSVISIGNNAFNECFYLTSIIFEGTIEEWNSVIKGSNWSYNTRTSYVQCSDGNVAL